MTGNANDTLCFLSAVDLARMIRTREISATELLDAHLARIDDVNPDVNAIVTVVAEEARLAAGQADQTLARSGPIGPLHGLPVAHKDLVPTRGIRTTFGSPIFSSHVPDADGLVVERLRAAGAITLGKTNTPEFGAGSQTFNTVFGATKNPYDLTRTCGGSSGGAAVALATGMVPLADGTDMGGSLRNPASFCNVVGLRPSPGRVPTWPSLTGWLTSPSVSGPMARTVADVSLMLGAIAGPDLRDPLALDQPWSHAPDLLDVDLRGRRIAWSRDLDGLPIDPAVTAVLETQRDTFVQLGCVVEDAAPDLTGADEIFRTWRAWYFDLAFGPLLPTHRAEMKDTVVWNIEAGQRLTSVDLSRMARLQTELHGRVLDFMARYDALVSPVTQVPPFDIAQPYVTEIDGHAMETYIDWMRSCYLISVTGLPAMSVPCGFTADTLPVGIQIVGRHRDETSLLQTARGFERATEHWRQRPRLPPTGA